MTTKKFQYQESMPLWYNGCYFHSRQELKFALSIERDYYYIREPLFIPYDPHTKLLPANARSNMHFYVPDFLIRHKQTMKAFLVEIKPAGYGDLKSLALREKLVQQLVSRQLFDWEYQLVIAESIVLHESVFDRYRAICRAPGHLLPYKRSFYTIVPVNHDTGLSNRDYISFLMRGIPPV